MPGPLPRSSNCSSRCWGGGRWSLRSFFNGLGNSEPTSHGCVGQCHVARGRAVGSSSESCLHEQGYNGESGQKTEAADRDVKHGAAAPVVGLRGHWHWQGRPGPPASGSHGPGAANGASTRHSRCTGLLLRLKTPPSPIGTQPRMIPVHACGAGGAGGGVTRRLWGVGARGTLGHFFFSLPRRLGESQRHVPTFPRRPGGFNDNDWVTKPCGGGGVTGWRFCPGILPPAPLHSALDRHHPVLDGGRRVHLPEPAVPLGPRGERVWLLRCAHGSNHRRAANWWVLWPLMWAPGLCAGGRRVGDGEGAGGEWSLVALVCRCGRCVSLSALPTT